jgi:phosphotransacetylase
MKLVRAFGGEILKPACCAEIYRPFRDAGIVAMVAAGEAHEVVAGLMGVSAKHVKNLLREIPREDASVAVRNMPPMSTAGTMKMMNNRRQRGKAR